MGIGEVLKCLTNSFSRFIHLVTFGAPKNLPCQQDYKYVSNSLKLFKRVLDNIDESFIQSNDILCKEFEDLDVAVNEAREFIENFNIHMSKFYRVEQSKHLISKIQRFSIKICDTIYGSLESTSSTSTSTLADIQLFMEEIKNLKPETAAEKLEEALKFIREQSVPPLELIMQIIELFQLSTGHELLKESLAVEKEYIKVNQPNQISYISDLVFHLREIMVNLESFKAIDGISVPSYFICPLTLQLMSEPVIVSTGQTYERDSIQKWIDNGLLRCPVTRRTLSHKNLIPNYTVKVLISNWCDENNVKIDRPDKSSSEDQLVSNLTIENGLDRLNFQKSNHRSTEESCSHSRSGSTSTVVSSSEHLCEMSGETACDSGVSMLPTGIHNSNCVNDVIKPNGGDRNYPRTVSLPPDSPLNDSTAFSHVKELVHDLKSPSNETQTKAAEEIRFLAKNDMENRILIGQSGAIQPLISLLHSNKKLTQEHAVTALLNLSINGNIKSMIAESGAVEPLIHVLETGNTCAKENAAAALFSLSLLEEYRVKIGQSGAVKPLVDLLGSGTLRGRKDAATALFNLSIFHENKARIIQAGAVKSLVELMDPETQMVDKAVALLSNLASVPEGCLVIAREGGIPLLVEVVETGSQRGKENAASILLQLCLNSPKYCRLVLQEGAVPPLVALSQSGTSRAKEKAQQLLSHFRSQRENASGRKKS